MVGIRSGPIIIGTSNPDGSFCIPVKYTWSLVCSARLAADTTPLGTRRGRPSVAFASLRLLMKALEC